MTDFKQGDRIRMIVEGTFLETGAGVPDYIRYKTGIMGDFLAYIPPHATVERIEAEAEPLQIGEKVIFNRSHDVVEVIYVDEAFAALRGYCDGRPDHRWFMPLSALSRPSCIPIKVEG